MNISEFFKAVNLYFETQNCARQLMTTAASSPNDFDTAYKASLVSQKFRPSQKRSEIKFLYNLIRQYHCKTICEIGTLRGGTLFMFCQAAADDARIVSVDINSTITRRHALHKLSKPGQKIKLVVGDSHSMAVERRIRKEFSKTGLDFLFIDGDHSLLGVLNDFVRYFPLVRSGGIIAFHDINPDSFIKTGIKTESYVGSVPCFWEMIQRQGFRAQQFIDDPSQDGFGIGIIYKE